MTLPTPTGYELPADSALQFSSVRQSHRLANIALHAVGQVNHCVMAWRTATLGHQDAAALAVGAQLMGSNLLHQALREKGGRTAAMRATTRILVCLH